MFRLVLSWPASRSQIDEEVVISYANVLEANRGIYLQALFQAHRIASHSLPPSIKIPPRHNPTNLGPNMLKIDSQLLQQRRFTIIPLRPKRSQPTRP
jgi:hypothetical protein